MISKETRFLARHLPGFRVEAVKALMAEGFEIEHATGQRFTMLAAVPGNNATQGSPLPVWPIEEYLARTKHKPNVAERIRRLNPDGKVEGERPRGWHPEIMNGRANNAWIDTCSIHRFDKVWGKGAHRKIKLVKIGGKRKAVTGIQMMQGPPS